MTRFARAKGSKSSNERVPNEATPWCVMKEQLESTLTQEHGQPLVKTKSAKELINEKDDLYYAKSLGNINTDWAEFEGTKNKIEKKKENKVEKKFKNKDKKSKKSLENSILESKNDDPNKDSKEFVESEKVNSLSEENDTKQNTEKPVHLYSGEGKSKKRKLHKNKKCKEALSEETEHKKQKVETENAHVEVEKLDFSNKLSKRQKRNMKKQNIKAEASSSTFNVSGNDWDNSVNHDDNRNLNNCNNEEKKFVQNDAQIDFTKKPFNQGFKKNKIDRFGGSIPRKYQKKTAKIRDDKVHKRRKPEVQVMKVTINGMDVEIVKYDGFPVKKEDAERLAKLRKEMVLKGIPKADIDAAMKLERRKCEKALARIRKQVCFHCRKAGHNLSECPELGQEEAATGICFKCGSTEHTHFECKVHKADDYKFAKCFICREQGHIAKQCPDNPKGLYPDGGGCKICGDVTHLKKDCPDFVKEQEETAITLNTIKDDNLESLDNEPVKDKKKVITKKVVKF